MESLARENVDIIHKLHYSLNKLKPQFELRIFWHKFYATPFTILCTKLYTDVICWTEWFRFFYYMYL